MQRQLRCRHIPGTSSRQGSAASCSLLGTKNGSVLMKSTLLEHQDGSQAHALKEGVSSGRGSICSAMPREYTGHAPVDLAKVLRRVGARAVVALARQEHAAEAAGAGAQVSNRRLCCGRQCARAQSIRSSAEAKWRTWPGFAFASLQAEPALMHSCCSRQRLRSKTQAG